MTNYVQNSMKSPTKNTKSQNHMYIYIHILSIIMCSVYCRWMIRHGCFPSAGPVLVKTIGILVYICYIVACEYSDLHSSIASRSKDVSSEPEQGRTRHTASDGPVSIA